MLNLRVCFTVRLVATTLIGFSGLAATSACAADERSSGEARSADDWSLGDDFPADGLPDGGALPADGLPAPGEPPLGSGYDDTVPACYNGSMTACDDLRLDDDILLDSVLGKYGRTCGWRLERLGQSKEGSCVDIFPGHE